jgi:diguanylate cyclase (GGDEF)-like protein
VLIQTAEVIRRTLFGRDILCRFGGEEFVILFTKTDKEGALIAVEEIRREIEHWKFHFTDEMKEGNLTISIGFASFDEIQSENIQDQLKLADDRLYQAKTTGKNTGSSMKRHLGSSFRVKRKMRIGLRFDSQFKV